MPMTFTQLTGAHTTEGSIRNWVNRASVPAETILTMAEAEIFSRLRVREMRTRTTLTVAAAASSVALPTNFLDPISLKDRYKVDLTLTDQDDFEDKCDVDSDFALIEGDPTFYAIFNEAFNFNTKMEEERQFTLHYFKQPTALSGTNETNFLTTRYPHVLLAGCRMAAELYAKNWTARDQAEKDLLKAIATIAVNDDLTYRGAVFSERY